MDLKNQQPPLTIEQQIENLKSLNLVIEDEEYARQILNDISYFRLIKAFGYGLKQRNSTFDGTVTFEHIVELYLFNSNFRQLLSAKIEQIEINLRCRISNYFSCKYGVLGYENADNFDYEDYSETFINEIYSEIDKKGNTPFVKNFQKNYVDGKLPFYALVELFSFGTLSKFYKNMKSADKKDIAKMFGVGYTYLQSWIEHIASVRNICAHYGRLYNIKLSKMPMLYKQYNGIAGNRVFATLLCFKHLLPNDRHWIEFVDNIELLFEKYPHVQKKYMGFPDDWYDLLTS